MSLQVDTVSSIQVLDACDALGIDWHGVTNLTVDAQARQVTVTRYIAPDPASDGHWPLRVSQTEVYPIRDDGTPA